LASRRAWPSGKRVLVTFDVQLDGRASNCQVFQSVGVPSIDAETCALVVRKLRFRPARDTAGRPVVAPYAYAQVALF
jgi:protein TonB